MGTQSRFAQDVDNFLLQTSALASLPEDMRSEAIRTARSLVIPVVDHFHEQRETVRRDPLLSLPGKRERLSRLAREAEAKLKAFTTRTVDVLTQRTADAIAAATLAAAPKGTNDPAEALMRELKAQEIRQRVQAMDPLMRRVKYLQAQREGNDDALVSAIEGAPSIAPLLTDATLMEGRAARAARLRPADVSQFETLASAYRFVTQSAISEIRPYLDGSDNIAAPGDVEERQYPADGA